MMKKRFLFILTASLLISCLTGCAQAEAVSETTVPAGPEIVEISRNAQQEGQSLTIGAMVEVPDLTQMEKVELNFDEDALQAMAKDLVLAQYPHIKEEKLEYGERRWSESTPERLTISLGCVDSSFQAGWCYYLDVVRDLNGQAMGDDDCRFFDARYLTPHIPNKLEMTSQEAAEKMGAELSKYSCFTFEPWSVTAYNVREKPDSSGYYSAIMQPHFEGKPVIGNGPVQARTAISAEGMFTFQGTMVLKETGRKSIEDPMTLEEAVERFQEEFTDFTYTDQTTVNRIAAGFVAVPVYNGTWTLHPAWIFEYMDADRDWTYTCAYTMESGALHLIR